ncbi:MAG: hypothetical protein ABI454_08855 [Sphingomicrobium sp.]
MSARPAIHISSREASTALVALFVPECIGEERERRASIHLAQDRARARAARCDSWEGSLIYHAGAQIAHEWWSRPNVGLDELNEVLAALALIAVAAGKFDRLEAARDC